MNGALASRQLTPRTLQAVRNGRLLAEDALHCAVISAPQRLRIEASLTMHGGPRWNAWQQECQALEADPQGYVQQKAVDSWWMLATAAIDDLQSSLNNEVEAAIRAAEVQISPIQQRAHWVT